MIYINTAKDKGTEHRVLRSGETFTAWRVDNDLHVETTMPDTTARKILIRKAANRLGVSYDKSTHD